MSIRRRNNGSRNGQRMCMTRQVAKEQNKWSQQVLGPGTLGRPRGIGWRGRWEGGSGWGIHVNPWLIHVNVWQKPLQYCKVINLQLLKINEQINK